MHKCRRILALCLLTFLLGMPAEAYTGGLTSSAGEISGTRAWSSNASMAWNVSAVDDYWNYSYVFSAAGKGVSHLILETSTAFTRDDLWGLTTTRGSIGSVEIGDFRAPSASKPDVQPNPFMPSDVYGIKFDGTEGESLAFSFNTRFAPAWGDFYAKSGKSGGVSVAAWNTTFSNPDPIEPAADGSIAGHILVPGSRGADPYDPIPVPEPASAVAVALGLAALMAKRRGE